MSITHRLFKKQLTCAPEGISYDRSQSKRKDGKGIISLTLITSTNLCSYLLPNKQVTNASSIILGVGIGNDVIKCVRVDPAFDVLVIRPVFAVLVMFRAVVRLFRKK